MSWKSSRAEYDCGFYNGSAIYGSFGSYQRRHFDKEVRHRTWYGSINTESGGALLIVIIVAMWPSQRIEGLTRNPSILDANFTLSEIMWRRDTRRVNVCP